MRRLLNTRQCCGSVAITIPDFLVCFGIPEALQTAGFLIIRLGDCILQRGLSTERCCAEVCVDRDAGVSRYVRYLVDRMCHYVEDDA